MGYGTHSQDEDSRRDLPSLPTHLSTECEQQITCIHIITGQDCAFYMFCYAKKGSMEQLQRCWYMSLLFQSVKQALFLYTGELYERLITPVCDAILWILCMKHSMRGDILTYPLSLLK
jgi:hypothetical protein